MMFLGTQLASNDHFEFAGIKIAPSNSVKLLGVEIDNNLNFNVHIKNICKIVNNKINALIRIRCYLDTDKALKICNAYILSQFNYCNLIWMFCSKTSNKSIIRSHKRALRITYQDTSSSYQELLEQNKCITIHQRNLQSLMCEVYKSINHLNPSFMWSFFKPKQLPYSLRKGPLLEMSTARGKIFGIYTIEFRSTISWNNLPIELKSTPSEHDFKRSLKKFLQSGKRIPCNCKLCRE